MKLVIVESPAKAKTIERYLSDIDPSGNFVVRASVGHVRDLPKSNKQAIDIPAGFVPHYEVVANKVQVIHDLKALAKKADEVILATDPDREGEAIAWHIKEELGLKDPDRIVFHEITKEAIQEALANPRHIDDNLRLAQEARRVLDRLVGYDLSGLIWKKVRYGLSAGRVQSPALRIIMEREREIRAFIPETYFVITADTKTPRGDDLQLVCIEEPHDPSTSSGQVPQTPGIAKKRVDEIIDAVKSGTLAVSDVTESEMKRAPRAPFTTSTLQQAASSRLGFSPANTMRIAQKLYEAGHITYMRTDSTNLGVPARDAMLKMVEKKFGKEYVQPHTFVAKSKNAQEAHEAVRPTHIEEESLGATPEQRRLYELIWRRAIASQMADAKLLKTKITAELDTPDFPAFTANGSRVLFDGWLKADPAARGEDVELPLVHSKEKLDVKDISAQEKQTAPPSRYSEAGLVRELEKRGIGRPSTYASTMKTLGDRGYVTREGRTLIPTDTGDVVSTFLEDNFPTYIGDTFTAEMEDELDQIAQGKREYVKTLKDFYTPFLKEVKLKDKEAGKITDLGPAPEEFPCPICGKPMVYKLSRQGKFMSCSTFPVCLGARSETGEVISNDAATSIGNHPTTGEPIFVFNGRFGPFVQLGESPPRGTKVRRKAGTPKVPPPRRASVPKGKDPTTVTPEEAAVYLSLPRVLGVHPDTNEPISASIGRFGPFIVHQKDFRSLKADDVYTIELPRALEILNEPKKKRGFAKKEKIA